MACIFYNKPCVFFVSGNGGNFPRKMPSSNAREIKIMADLEETTVAVFYEVCHPGRLKP